MAFNKIDSAEKTNFSSKTYANSAAAQDSTLFPSSYRPVAAAETTESEYQNTNWPTQHGAYQEVSELAGLIDRKAQFVVGKGFKADKKTSEILKKIRGNGLDSFNLVNYNAVRTYTIGGDFYAEQIRNARSVLRNLKPLNPSTIKVIANSRGAIKEYQHFPINVGTARQSDKPEKTFEPGEIFHLAYNRIADQIHGQSVIDKLKDILEMRREAMKDIRVVFHRYVKPLWIFSVDTDDPTEIKTFKDKVDSTIEKAENLVVPKDTVANIERVSIPRFSNLDPMPWLNLLQKEFIKAEGVPSIAQGVGAEEGEAEAKILYLAFQQVIEFNQMFMEEQIKTQLGLDVKFQFPASIAPELINDEGKANNLTPKTGDASKDQR